MNYIFLLVEIFLLVRLADTARRTLWSGVHPWNETAKTMCPVLDGLG